MVVPVLQNPVKVTISRIDRTGTKWNNRLRENVNVIKQESSFIIDAQIVYKRVMTDGAQDKINFDGEQNVGIAGVTFESDGYFIVRYADLQAAGKTVGRGDRITKLGQVDVDYNIVGLRPTAHYADQGGFTLLMIFFSERSP